jgi:hypothetical protein
MKTEDKKIKSREQCPAKMVCSCFSDKNWDGFCKIKKGSLCKDKT